MRYGEHFLNEDVEVSENYCRNPALRERPWCFVSDPNVIWEFCDIPLCKDIMYPDCKKTEKGKEYIGKIEKTKTGKDCLRWDQRPYRTPKDFSPVMRYGEHFLNEDVEVSENYCRNPALRERPWCFVSDPNVIWEFCDIPLCKDIIPLECKLTQKGGEYVGKKSSTIAGTKCLPWLSAPMETQYRAWSERLPAFSDDVDKNHNYCRNPGGRPGGPWCYDGEYQKAGWNYCDVPFCQLQGKVADENQETTLTFPYCRLTEMGKEYMGMVRTSETGKPCMKWNDFSDMTTFPDIMMKILPLTVDSKEMKKYRNFFTEDPKSHINFCRNPGWGQRPWCFVSKYPAVKWEYCDIPFCKDRAPLECMLTTKGWDYMGKKNVSSRGLPCEPWLKYLADNSKGENDIHLFPDPVDSRHNFCRSLYDVWNTHCFVLQDGRLRMDFCSVPYCYEILESISTTPPECKLTEWGWDYAGRKNQTIGGLPCLPWSAAGGYQPEFSEVENDFPEYAGAEDHNYCRSNNSEISGIHIQGPYCHVPVESELKLFGSINVDICGVPFCPLKSQPTD
ncbi:unnamed protein product [Darwinula stevensoni]|uniref:Kringle domain-containing protein n=1 Tax=Darwinula stevensoni TaxID=69355 RepID=A0A7R9A7C9_9CRUS|nr:unnamed protein product [Darwinula stevensoni]CAG0891250.1 unnamed protein product [Darwinula stevensoni]